MDWATRRVLSWRLSNTLDARFCTDALTEALERYGRPQIFNTDQGSQFTSLEFTATLKDAGVAISMDGRGRCMDNIFIERLWRSLKYEAVYLHELSDGFQAQRAFGTLAGDTAFVGVDASTALGRWRIGANAELGMVAPATRGGLLTRVSSLTTSAFALHAIRALAGSGALRFSVSQPLRVESGRRDQAGRGLQPPAGASWSRGSGAHVSRRLALGFLSQAARASHCS